LPPASALRSRPRGLPPESPQARRSTCGDLIAGRQGGGVTGGDRAILIRHVG
jgi:hypothetical protein